MARKEDFDTSVPLPPGLSLVAIRKAVDYLESKASKWVWAIQSHYDHPGWYIVWRYLVDQTE